MTVQEIRSEEEFLEKVVTGASIIEFYATWCGRCKELAPKLDGLAENTKDVVFLKVKVNDPQSLTERYAITVLPTIIGLKDGQIIGRVDSANFKKITELVGKLTE